MCVVEALAVGTTALSVGGQVMSFGAQKKASYQNQLYQLQVEGQNLKYRTELMEYQTEQFGIDIAYGNELLDYQRNEFAREQGFVARATENIETNRFAKYGQILTRMVEEAMSSALDQNQTEKHGAAMRSSALARAASAGLEGSSIEQIVNDISRQEGEATAVLEMNRDATMRQLYMELQGIKADSDQAILNLPLNTYSPSKPISTPSPVAQVQTTQVGSTSSNGSLLAGVGASLVGGLNNYASWSGQSVKSVLKL